MRQANLVYEVDKICRHDISQKILVSERDYVSQFCTLLRRPRGLQFPSNLVIHSQTLPGNAEQKFGCDAIILIRTPLGFKVGLFEVKFPCYKSVNRRYKYKPWDDGRFSKQLKKQADTSIKYPDIVIWNQFIDNSIPGNKNIPFIDKYGSSCILHSDIYKHKIKGKNWLKKDIDYCLSKYGINYSKLISRIYNCEIGKPLKPVDNKLILRNTENNNDGDTLYIPISNIESAYFDDRPVIERFMKEYGLTTYILLNR